MSHDPQVFRARYRAAIHPRYNAWLHGGFVLAWGIACRCRSVPPPCHGSTRRAHHAIARPGMHRLFERLDIIDSRPATARTGI